MHLQEYKLMDCAIGLVQKYHSCHLNCYFSKQTIELVMLLLLTSLFLIFLMTMWSHGIQAQYQQRFYCS
uniref:Uncharacterized protein n=1 Tax=Arundo donax TaxID=35708 RepID=A0A0A9FH83_ARUDO